MNFYKFKSTQNVQIGSKILSCLIITSFLTSCTAFKNFDKQDKEEIVHQAVSQNLSMERLTVATENAALALIRLSRIESARTPIKPVKAEGLIPNTLEKNMSFEWVGPLNGITQKLATEANYELVLIGKKPVSPIIVDIESRDRSIIELLKETGYQAGSRAHIRVDARKSIVEVIYAH